MSLICFFSPARSSYSPSPATVPELSFIVMSTVIDSSDRLKKPAFERSSTLFSPVYSRFHSVVSVAIPTGTAGIDWPEIPIGAWL